LLKLNNLDWVFVYADDITLLGENINTINSEVLQYSHITGTIFNCVIASIA